jgi:hypothetical protein
MTENVPLYATAKNGLSAANDQSRKIGVRVARSLTDMMQVVAIRASVFMSDQSCPYEEEFDGNDFCATHLIGYMGNEPAACIRCENRVSQDSTRFSNSSRRHRACPQERLPPHLWSRPGSPGEFLGSFRRQAARTQSQARVLGFLIYRDGD